LSYGVGSQLNAPAASDGGRFVVQAIAAPQNADKVEASFRDELATVLRDGYSDEEVATAKDSLLQGRQVGRNQDGSLTGALLNQTHNGRTMAWDADFEAKISALTAADVRAALQRYLDVTKMAFMKGGDFKGASSN
jgi:zinc protease